MSSEARLVWFKGNVVPVSEANISVLSPTAQFGLNVFEGIRGYWNETEQQLFLFRLDEHIERLFNSCRLIGIECPYSSADIISALEKVIQANGYREDVAVRVTVFVDGEGSWSNSSPVEMFVAPITRSRVAVDQVECLKACISTWERIDDRSLPPRVKAGANYINGRYAYLEAKAAGYDLPIMLDRSGKVSEGAGACLMMVKGGVLCTPPSSASILESITRDTLFALSRDLNLECSIRTIDRSELYLAEEVFMCGSAAEITPVTKIDRFTIGNGEMGKVTSELLSLYRRVVQGLEPKYQSWLTPAWYEAFPDV